MRTRHIKFFAVPPAPTFLASGFTLIELAIVLFVVALLLGGMLLPLSAQQDVRSYGDTQKILTDARDALVGFAMAALASVTFLIVGAAPAGPGYENQEAFQAVLGFVPRIVFASLVGYVVGQLLNAYVLVWLKRRGEGRLWARLIGSTVVGEFADTALFAFIAFAGIFPSWGSLLSFTVVGYLYKVAVEVICLPFTYRVIGWIKRREALV